MFEDELEQIERRELKRVNFNSRLLSGLNSMQYFAAEYGSGQTAKNGTRPMRADRVIARWQKRRMESSDV